MIREHLTAIYAEHGTLTPALVVAAARPVEHPLHERVFDKPVEEAAEAYYLDRAAEVIRTARITFTDGDGEPKSLRAFASLPGPGGRSYEPVEDVALDPFKRQLALSEMRRELTALELRFRDFAEWLTLLDEARSRVA